VLLNHLKNYSVSHGLGALKLKRDIQEYAKCFTAIFGSLSIEFSVLETISALHMVESKSIGGLIDDSLKIHLTKQQLIAFLKTRHDFDPQWLATWNLLT